MLSPAIAHIRYVRGAPATTIEYDVEVTGTGANPEFNELRLSAIGVVAAHLGGRVSLLHEPIVVHQIEWLGPLRYRVTVRHPAIVAA